MKSETPGHVEKVAIVGATGNIGSSFTQALLKTGKHTVTALVRPESKGKVPEGVKVVRSDFNNESSLVEALKGQEVLIITLSTMAPLEVHDRLVVAAKKAGVRYVVPNLYGYPIDRSNSQNGESNGNSYDQVFLDRYPYVQKFLDKVTEIESDGLRWFVLATGFWYEWSLALGEQCFGFNIKDRRVTFFDDGKRTITTTTWAQCGRAMAALLSLPQQGPSASPSLVDFLGTQVRVGSFRVSQRDMLDSLNRVLGTTDADWEIKYESSKKRVKDGIEALEKGNKVGFAKALYSSVFDPSYKQGDYGAVEPLANDALRLPKEDLDEATRKVVAMIESGWNPWS